MNKKVLFLLALTLFAFTSTIATATVALNTLTLNSFSTTDFIAETISSGDVQPLGDPIDDPVAPM